MNNLDTFQSKKTETDQPSSKSSSTGTGRDQYIEMVRDRLTKIQSRIESLKADGARLAGDMKRKADDNLAKLEAQQKEIKVKLDQIKSATEEKWQKEKDGIEKIYQEISTNFKGLFNS